MAKISRTTLGWSSSAQIAWRTRVIYETNLATSYAAGRLAQLKQGEYPYWMYRHADAVARPRPQHLAWDGLTLPPDHAFWQTHGPPNGWGCKCRIIGVRSANQAKKLGGDPDKALPKGWDTVDRKTGELPGIDKGWGYQPGESALDTVQAAAKKTMQWDYTLAKAYMSDVPAAQRDALATAIRTQPETGEAVRRYAQRVLGKVEADVPPYQTMGLLTTDEAKQVAELTGVPAVAEELYDWTVDANTVLHIQEKHGSPGGEASRGQIEVIASDYAVAPRIIAQSDRVWAEDEGATVMMEKVLGEKRYVLAWEVRRQRRMVALSSMRIHRHTPRAQRPDRS